MLIVFIYVDSLHGGERIGERGLLPKLLLFVILFVCVVFLFVCVY